MPSAEEAGHLGMETDGQTDKHKMQVEKLGFYHVFTYLSYLRIFFKSKSGSFFISCLSKSVHFHVLTRFGSYYVMDIYHHTQKAIL